MTRTEAIAYIQACEFMRNISFAPTSWEQDADADEHLKEALEVLGIDPGAKRHQKVVDEHI